ncbi:RNA-binding protein 47-like [Macrobrachium nipponense]|uniref:RNA-binding protein 47-like n=1 Tax=Macrobrachium nipponense TaxID=159736 RepID=UPI0030C7C2C8
MEHGIERDIRYNWRRCNRAVVQLQRQGYGPIVQVHGQRIYGPPPNWVDPVPPRGSEVFLGNLPRDLYEDELLPIVERIGPIYKMRLMLDFTGTNRGYAFVTFKDPYYAVRAVEALQRFEIRPRRVLGVMLSLDNRRLFLGNIPKEKTRNELHREMCRLTENVERIIMYLDIQNRSKNRGYALVEYSTHRDAAMARRRLFSEGSVLWDDVQVNVDWAVPELHDLDPQMREVT